MLKKSSDEQKLVIKLWELLESDKHEGISYMNLKTAIHCILGFNQELTAKSYEKHILSKKIIQELKKHFRLFYLNKINECEKVIPKTLYNTKTSLKESKTRNYLINTEGDKLKFEDKMNKSVANLLNKTIKKKPQMIENAKKKSKEILKSFIINAQDTRSKSRLNKSEKKLNKSTILSKYIKKKPENMKKENLSSK